jgi:hypothetical protein
MHLTMQNARAYLFRLTPTAYAKKCTTEYCASIKNSWQTSEPFLHGGREGVKNRYPNTVHRNLRAIRLDGCPPPLELSASMLPLKAVACSCLSTFMLPSRPSLARGCTTVCVIWFHGYPSRPCLARELSPKVEGDAGSVAATRLEPPARHGRISHNIADRSNSAANAWTTAQTPPVTVCHRQVRSVAHPTRFRSHGNQPLFR